MQTLGDGQQALWASAEAVVVVGSNQQVWVGEAGGSLQRLDDVPAGTFTAVWAFGTNDVWAVNAGAILHFDGTGWDQVHDTAGEWVQLWSDGTDLYFLSTRQFGRIVRESGLAVEDLASLPEGTIRFSSLWGYSKDEVFVSLLDPDFAQVACGEQFMLWFDGSTLRPF